MIDPHRSDCASRNERPCDCAYARVGDEMRRRFGFGDGASCAVFVPPASANENEPGYRPTWAEVLR